MQLSPLLPKIESPQDLKNFSITELNRLAGEIREKIILTVSANGGHLASNLGVVELSIALHFVFDSPNDKIVWDVGHQCYAHKLLTGRFSSFSSLRKSGGVAGFPKRSESPHDAFNTGHSSTSISAALGLLAAEKINDTQYSAIAVIGDGALTGGLAYEALSHAGHLGLPLIVILNDNKMSISPNVGGISKYLSRLSMKKKYQLFRRNFDKLTKKIPLAGDVIFDFIQRLKRAVKAVFYTDNFFVDLGFEYVGPIGGHNIQILIEVLQDAKKLRRPVVIHAVTRKGKGFPYAEDAPDSYHGVTSFSIDNGLKPAETEKSEQDKRISFTEAFSKILIEAAHDNKNIIAVTAAMRTGTGLSNFSQIFKERFFDVGIAEEHAVTFAAGLAAGGLKPVVAIYSTFIQRAVDQVIHDSALQKLPIILVLDRAGFVDADGETHQGLFDIALFRSLPNTAILCPASETEIKLLFNWALNHDLTTIIRYPKACCPEEAGAFSLPVETGRGVWLKKSSAEICIFFTGSLYNEIIDAYNILKGLKIETDLYNLRFLKPIDEKHFTEITGCYKLVVIIEEGVREGGFSEYATNIIKNSAATAIIAVENGFFGENRALGTRKKLLSENKLDGKGIVEKIISEYGSVMNKKNNV